MKLTQNQRQHDVQSAVVELRQYTLHPGKRDTLIELFEREFIEPQAQVGIELIGQFRERNNPDLFVWLRGFPNMDARRVALDAFYSGLAWAAHRDAANATMIDSDNVLLLRPAWPESGFRASSQPLGDQDTAAAVFVASVYALDPSPSPGFLTFIKDELLPVAAAAGAARVAEMVTEPSPNTFPGLPVRENEEVFVSFARFPSPMVYERYCTRLSQSRAWQSVVRELERRHAQLRQVLELIPTRGSALV